MKKLIPLLCLATMSIAIVSCKNKKGKNWASGLDQELLADVVITPELSAAAPKYDMLGEFSEGLAPVLNKDQKLGYINVKGEEVIPCQFKPHEDRVSGWDLTMSKFSGGVAPVCTQDNKWGIINNKGEWVVEPTLEYSWILPFSHGLAPYFVQDENGACKECGFIDTKGGVAIQGAPDWGWYYCDPEWVTDDVIRVDSRPLYINKKGEVVSEPTIPETTSTEKRYVWARNGERTYTDADFKFEERGADAPIWDQGFTFSNGLIVVTLTASVPDTDEYYSEYGYMDRTGKTTFTPEQYDKIRKMQEVFYKRAASYGYEY